jgi:hypothetical protein
MQFKLLSTTTLPLQPQLQWLWYSDQSRGFVTGDDRAAFLLPVANPAAPTPLQPARQFDASSPPRHPCNLPVPASMLDEFLHEPWHGFRFLEASEYDHAVDEKRAPVGDLLRTLVFGPNYGHYILHPPSGLILGLWSGSIDLLQRDEAGAFKRLDQTKTRGRAALAFSAHPSELLIAYGDNYGTFHAHRFDPTGFGKASKIAAKDRKASRLEFVRAGSMLAIGGMGYLATYSFDGGKFAPLHEVSISVRDFLWLKDGELVLVNQGLHGVAAYRHDPGGFRKLGELKPDGAAAVQHIAVSKCLRYLALCPQGQPDVSVYAISAPA